MPLVAQALTSISVTPSNSTVGLTCNSALQRAGISQLTLERLGGKEGESCYPDAAKLGLLVAG
jgi:hypothetical protein